MRLGTVYSIQLTSSSRTLAFCSTFLYSQYDNTSRLTTSPSFWFIFLRTVLPTRHWIITSSILIKLEMTLRLCSGCRRRKADIDFDRDLRGSLRRTCRQCLVWFTSGPSTDRSSSNICRRHINNECTSLQEYRCGLFWDSWGCDRVGDIVCRFLARYIWVPITSDSDTHICLTYHSMFLPQRKEVTTYLPNQANPTIHDSLHLAFLNAPHSTITYPCISNAYPTGQSRRDEAQRDSPWSQSTCLKTKPFSAPQTIFHT